MCVIIVGSKLRPALQTLLDCEAGNGDGAGIAWITPQRKVRFVKGIDAKGAYEVLRAKVPKGAPYAVHFRIATIGGKSSELTHPFVISEKSELHLEGEVDSVLFHNGHFGGYYTLRKEIEAMEGVAELEGAVSDSRVVAWAAHFKGAEIIDKVEGRYAILSGEHGVLLSPDPKQSSMWAVHKGLLYSNLYWQRSAAYSKFADATVGTVDIRKEGVLRAAAALRRAGYYLETHDLEQYRQQLLKLEVDAPDLELWREAIMEAADNDPVIAEGTLSRRAQKQRAKANREMRTRAKAAEARERNLRDSRDTHERSTALFAYHKAMDDQRLRKASIFGQHIITVGGVSVPQESVRQSPVPSPMEARAAIASAAAANRARVALAAMDRKQVDQQRHQAALSKPTWQQEKRDLTVTPSDPDNPRVLAQM